MPDTDKKVGKLVKLAPYPQAVDEGEIPRRWPYYVMGVDEELLVQTMREFDCDLTVYRRYYRTIQECFASLDMGEIRHVVVYRCQRRRMATEIPGGETIEPHGGATELPRSGGLGAAVLSTGTLAAEVPRDVLVGYIWLSVGYSCGTLVYMCPTGDDWSVRRCIGGRAIQYKLISDYLSRVNRQN